MTCPLLNQICLSPWLVLFRYGSCIPRRMPGICVNKDGYIGRQMKHNLTHMIKERHIPNYHVCEQETLECVYILRERISVKYQLESHSTPANHFYQ